MIWNNYKGEYKRANNKDIDSFALIKLLLEDKDTFLDRITCDDQIMKSQFYDKVDTYITLEYPPSCIKYKTYKPPMNIKFFKVFFDFETIKEDEGVLSYHTRVHEGSCGIFLHLSTGNIIMI